LDSLKWIPIYGLRPMGMTVGGYSLARIRLNAFYHYRNEKMRVLSIGIILESSIYQHQFTEMIGLTKGRSTACYF